MSRSRLRRALWATALVATLVVVSTAPALGVQGPLSNACGVGPSMDPDG